MEGPGRGHAGRTPERINADYSALAAVYGDLCYKRGVQMELVSELIRRGRPIAREMEMLSAIEASMLRTRNEIDALNDEMGRLGGGPPAERPDPPADEGAGLEWTR